MEIEQRQASEVRDAPERKEAPLVRKENMYTQYKPFMAFVVKQFTFDAIPISEYQNIYSEDPVATLKNQIKYYQNLLLKCAKEVQSLNDEHDVFVFLVECEQKRLKDHCYEVTSKVLDLSNQDFRMALDKELKIRKPSHFDPDFSGTVSFAQARLHLEYKTYKDKVYPKVVISSIRKIIRMILIVEKVFHILKRPQPIECFFLFHYCKNQVGSDLPEQLTLKLKADLTIRLEFIRMSSFKTELGNM